jgi:hypothetical protein
MARGEEAVVTVSSLIKRRKVSAWLTAREFLARVLAPICGPPF